MKDQTTQAATAMCGHCGACTICGEMGCRASHGPEEDDGPRPVLDDRAVAAEKVLREEGRTTFADSIAALRGRVQTFTDDEAFTDSGLHGVVLVLDASDQVWIAFETEDGWLAVRDRHEDDHPGPESDEWRPIGPASIEALPFPGRVVNAHEVLS